MPRKPKLEKKVITVILDGTLTPNKDQKAAVPLEVKGVRP